MALPTKTQWAALKNNAGIAKSPWWKTADAAVGPALAKLESSKAAYKGAKNLTNAQSYLGALSKLHAAFQKFITKKDLSTAGPLKTQIEGWMNEVATKHTALILKLPKIKENDAAELDKILDENF